MLVNSALNINFCDLIYVIIWAIVKVSVSTLSYGFRNITQFLQLCYELLAMYIIITNTQKFLHYTAEATITAFLSIMSVN